MHWKKRIIRISVWEAHGFRITEDADGEDKPFRLESPDGDPEWFPSLEAAKAVATLQNELEITKADNARLRAELGQRRGEWPDDDGRGIPVAEVRPSATIDEEDLDFGEPLEAGFPPDAGQDIHMLNGHY